MPEKQIHLVSPRPQISVHFNDDGDVVISTAGASDDFNRVEMHEVVIPIDCVEEVGRALLDAVSPKPGTGASSSPDAIEIPQFKR